MIINTYEAAATLTVGVDAFRNVGRFRNSLNGDVSVIMDQHIVPIGPHYVPVGSKLSAIIAIAPTVSPLIIQLF